MTPRCLSPFFPNFLSDVTAYIKNQTIFRVQAIVGYLYIITNPQHQAAATGYDGLSCSCNNWLHRSQYQL